MFCARCGRQQMQDAQFCPGCGSNVNAGGAHQQPMGPGPQQNVVINQNIGMHQQSMQPQQFSIMLNIVRALLIWFLWFIGSIIINYTPLRPQGFKSRTLGLLFFGILTLGIYVLVVAVCNLIFNPNSDRNIGYHRTR